MSKHSLGLAVLAVLLVACSIGTVVSPAPTTEIAGSSTSVAGMSTSTSVAGMSTSTTSAPQTEEIDAEALLMDVLDLGAGWIPAPDPDVSETATLSPSNCNDIAQRAPEDYSQVSVAFSNPGAGSVLSHIVEVYATVEDASVALQVLSDLVQTCRSYVVDETNKLDISGGYAIPSEPLYVSYTGSITRLSDGASVGFQQAAVQRGRVLSFLQITNPGYDVSSLIGAMLRRLPPPDGDPYVLEIPSDTTPPIAAPTPTPAATSGLAAQVQQWGFFDVPQLGTEPVRGSGCGADGSLGDALPDGLWAGFVRSWNSVSIDFDIICVYIGAAADELYATACQQDPETCGFIDPTWVLTNPNQRVRSVPLAPSVRYLAGFRPSEAITTDPTSPDATWQYTESWIVVEGGVATFVWSTAPYG